MAGRRAQFNVRFCLHSIFLYLFVDQPAFLHRNKFPADSGDHRIVSRCGEDGEKGGYVAKSGDNSSKTTRKRVAVEARVMKSKSKIGRPKGKRLTQKLGAELQAFVAAELEKKELQPKTFHEQISATLKTGYKIINKPVTVKRDLRWIYTAKIPFRVPYGESIKSVLQSPLPVSIEELLRARKIRPGTGSGTPSHLDTKEYFNHFFDYIKSNGQKKKVRVFARWTNLELRKNMLKFGPHDLFERFDEVVKLGLLDVEYVSRIGTVGV